VKLEATSSEPGCPLRAPAANVGMVPLCKDTFFGKLRLQMWERTEKGDQGRVRFPFLLVISVQQPNHYFILLVCILEGVICPV
jgi:hypothetical protein